MAPSIKISLIFFIIMVILPISVGIKAIVTIIALHIIPILTKDMDDDWRKSL